MTESEARRVLGVESTAPTAHVRQAYLDLVKVWHPDRFEHDGRLREKASQSLQRVNEAYAVLQRSPGRADSAAPASSPPPPSASPRSSPASTPNSAASASPTRGVLRVLKYRRDVIAAFVASIVGVALALTLLVGSSETPDAPPTATPAATDIELPADPRPKAADLHLERRPESGTDLKASGPRGGAAMSIQNQTAADAVVELRSEPDRRRVLYVRGGEKITLLDLMAGEYRVRLLLGRGWTGRGFSDAQGYRARRLPMQVEAAQRGAPMASMVIVRTSDELDVVPPFRLE